MANIFNIETSSLQCSVSIAKDGETIFGFESSKEMDHSVSLAPFIEKCLDFLKDRKETLDAVSVSNGPGSYTGLRIGLSMAKGIAFALDIPLITLSSLEILAVRAIFTYPDFEGDELIVPMIDARRMEVYTAVYDSGLNLHLAPQAKILEEDSFSNFYDASKMLFIGNGSEKFKKLYKSNNAVWLGKGMPHAKFMASLSEKYYRDKRFADTAYATPFYLKDYQTTVSKKNIYNDRV